MPRYVQENISSPIHVKSSRCVSMRNPLEGVPALSSHKATQSGILYADKRLLQSVCHANLELFQSYHYYIHPEYFKE